MFTYRSIPYLLPLCLLLFTTRANAQPDLQKITVLLDSTMKAENIPAVSIGIVSKGKTYFINRGVADRSRPIEVDENSLYQIASLGKPLIGIVANELMLRGKLRANQPITDFLAKRFSAKRRAVLSTITIGDLLHHTAGLPQDATVAYRRKDGHPYQYDYQEEDFYTDLDRVKIKRIGQYSYSNFGFALATYILEKASGKAYEALLDEYVLSPLSMPSTGSIPIDKTRLTTPYRKDKREVPTGYWMMGKMAPPSGLYSSAADLTRLLSHQLSAYQAYRKDDKVNRWIISHDRVQKRDEPRDTYGYGCQIWDNFVFGHGGDMDGYAATYTLFPDDDYGVVMLTSSGEDWMRPFISEVYGVLAADN